MKTTIATSCRNLHIDLWLDNSWEINVAMNEKLIGT